MKPPSLSVHFEYSSHGVLMFGSVLDLDIYKCDKDIADLEIASALGAMLAIPFPGQRSAWREACGLPEVPNDRRSKETK